MPQPLKRPSNFVALNPISEGTRNDALFRHLLENAASAKSCDGLSGIAHRFNTARLSPPLPTVEVEKTAASAWKYQQQGKNRLGAPPSAWLPFTEIDRLLSEPKGADALALLCLLKRNHGARSARGEPFAIVCKAMARDRSIKGWRSPRKYNNALSVLQKLGFVVRLRPSHRQGGRYLPARWILAKPG